MKAMLKFAPLACALLLPCAALAQGVAGTWKAIDDETKQPKALVQVSESPTGELSGRIVKLFANPDALCDKCDGDRKGKPIQGMTILWGLKKAGDGWEGGKILDPKKGAVYSAKMRLADDGKKLEVRGFMGVSLLGRTQIWERQ
ncbi:uncharacterized protein (DUF2147 family) [Crenobacter luteus]|uniref:DUF2147 domain-containing protein n=1 Tax=Crenobacter luteus TaxID=1452487 RepID=UPI0010473E07|nr:DUF2147 domain-containing protein [Crenobacter luteus]TCP14813.1 uncharacterized protein (DUF2147 family) [Crenobacter luteus]